MFLINAFFLMYAPGRPLVSALCFVFYSILILKVKDGLPRTIIFALSLPLLIDSSLILYKYMVAFPLLGLKPRDLLTFPEFISPQLEYLQETATYLITVSTFLIFTLIIIAWTAQSTLNIYIRILPSLIFTPVQFLFAFFLLFSAMELSGDKILTSEIAWKDSSIKKYFFSYGGAASYTGSEITQERPLRWGVKITKLHWKTSSCYDAKMKLIDNRILEIAPFNCGSEHEINDHIILKSI